MTRQRIAYYEDYYYYKEGDEFKYGREYTPGVQFDERIHTIDLDEMQEMMTVDGIEYYKHTLDYIAEVDDRLVTPVYLPTQLVAMMQQSANNDDVSLIEWLLGAIHALLEVIEEENS